MPGTWEIGNWELWLLKHRYKEWNQLIHVILQLHRQGQLYLQCWRSLWEGSDPSPSPQEFISGCSIPAVPALSHISGPGSGSSTEDSGLASQCPSKPHSHWDQPHSSGINQNLQNTPQGRLHPRPRALENPSTLRSTLPEITLGALREQIPPSAPGSSSFPG